MPPNVVMRNTMYRREQGDSPVRLAVPLQESSADPHRSKLPAFAQSISLE
jgi:hypothetical protein